MKQNKIFIYGRHALMEALLNAPDVVDKLFLSKDDSYDIGLIQWGALGCYCRLQ